MNNKLWLLLLGTFVTTTLLGMDLDDQLSKVSQKNQITDFSKLSSVVPPQLPEEIQVAILHQLIEIHLIEGSFIPLRNGIKLWRLVSRQMRDEIDRLTGNVAPERNRTKSLVHACKFKYPHLLVSSRALDYWLLSLQMRTKKWHTLDMLPINEKQADTIEAIKSYAHQLRIKFPDFNQLPTAELRINSNWIDQLALIDKITLYRDFCRTTFPYIMQAVRDEEVELLKMWLTTGNVNYQDGRGINLLMKAVLAKRISIVRKLLRAGADLNQQDSKGRTVLMQACLTADKDLVEILLDAGANTNIQDIHGNSALWFAVPFFSESNIDMQIISLLLEKGALANLSNINNKTPLMQAYRYGHTNIADLLVKAIATTNNIATKKTKQRCTIM